MNKKIYIYKIIFITFFILILLDIAGYIKNFESFVFAFFAILFIIHGIYIINFFSSVKKGFHMIYGWFKRIVKKIVDLFHKKQKLKSKKRIVTKKTITKKENNIPKKTIKNNK